MTVAQRAREPRLVNAAYDLLECKLPADCAAFCAEAMREARKTVYGEHMRASIGERFAKWTTRH